jgi:dCMP deaminase
MEIVRSVAKASTCRVKIGCIILKKNTIVGVGYVGSVHGDIHCEDVGCLFVDAPHQGSSDSGKSCIRTIHAEMNAILKCQIRGSVDDGWLDCYSIYQPCLICFKLLLQIGVRHIYYEKLYKDEWRDVLMNTMYFEEVQIMERIHA